MANEVFDILDMWSIIEACYFRHLEESDKERIQSEAEPFGDRVEFAGFDGNNESLHYAVATFLVKRMGRYEEFAGRKLNSHAQWLEGYKRMPDKFKPMRKELGRRGLTADQIITLLRALRHPSLA